jgi:hypothetical protein
MLGVNLKVIKALNYWAETPGIAAITRAQSSQIQGTPGAHPGASSRRPTLDITIPHKICHSQTETLGNPMEGAES